MFELAICYFSGRGVAQDDRAGYRLLARSAEHGCILALYEQSSCLRQGIGIPRNVRLATKLKRKALKLMKQVDQAATVVEQRIRSASPTRQRIKKE